MNAQDIFTQARDTLTVKRVFGEPYEKNGVTIFPVASVAGGAGGGSGDQGDGQTGSGGGFGVRARPAGVYVLKGDDVQWIPAFDLNRVVMGGQIVAIVALLTVRTIAKARARGNQMDHICP